MQAPTTAPNRIWPNWWRFGGIDGIIWAILFFVGNGISGESPSRDDSVADIREYFTNDGDAYLTGDYILGIAFVIFFLPFVIALGYYLARAEGSPPIWSTMTLVGGIMAVAIAAAAGMAWGALALTMERNPDLDDATIMFLMDMDIYGYTLLNFGLALFVGSAGFAVFRTGLLWKWTGLLGILAAILLVIGAAWVIDGDDEGTLATITFPGYIGSAIFVLICSVGMIMRKELPEVPAA
jgi:hypothetical protein